MANITYRVSSSPGTPGSSTVKGTGLSNLEIDQNFYSLNFELAGYKDANLTFTNKTISGTVNTFTNIPLGSAVTGTLTVANGGTGQTTAQAAVNALLGSVGTGTFARGNGTNVVMSGIQVSDVPTLNQNTTGTASNITGVLSVANGGTGAISSDTARNAFNRGATQTLTSTDTGLTLLVGKTYMVDMLTGAVAYSVNMPSVANSVVGDQIILGNVLGSWASYTFTVNCPAWVQFVVPNGAASIYDSALACDSNIGGLTLQCTKNNGTNAYWSII
jgi:hypothetical protein